MKTDIQVLSERPELCKDAVSRADVLECFADLYDTFEDCSKGIINELHRKFEDLRTLPSVPAAYVFYPIRCKDCKYFYDWFDDKCCMNHVGVVLTDENGFCHHAKRKDNSEE